MGEDDRALWHVTWHAAAHLFQKPLHISTWYIHPWSGPEQHHSTSWTSRSLSLPHPVLQQILLAVLSEHTEEPGANPSPGVLPPPHSKPP